MINLIPYPKSIKELNGFFDIEETISLTNKDFPEYTTNVFYQRINIKPIEGEDLTIIKDLSLIEGAYKLSVGQNKIVLTSSSNIGVINGLTSLFWLIDGDKIPCVEIEDAPSLKYRGAHLDSSRHFFKFEEILLFIDELSKVKINYFHWHLSDDQGYRIESIKYPKLNEKSIDFYRIEEIKYIVEYAKERGIEIIPEIDIPGHTSAILAAYPELGCFNKEVPVRTKYGIFKEILCPSKIKTIDFIKDLLLEVIELFPCKYFHIGGDEAPKKEWRECPNCKKKMKELSLDNYLDLQGHFTNEIKLFLKENGKETICWNDTLDSKLVSNDITIQYWELARRKATQDFLNKGGNVIYSDMFEYYFDYPYSMTNLKKVYENDPHFGKDMVFNEIYGMEACLWTERVLDNVTLEGRMFPRIFAVAERAWGPKTSYKNFESRLKYYLLNKNTSIHFLPINKWNPKGLNRIKETIKYLSLMTKNTNVVDSESPFNIEIVKAFIKKFLL